VKLILKEEMQYFTILSTMLDIVSLRL